MGGFGIFLIVLIILIVLASIILLFLSRRRASAQGLPPPPLSSYNPFSSSSVAWIKNKFASLRRGRQRDVEGGYEGASGGRGRGLRDDEGGAWDARMGGGRDDYFEEQELGPHDGDRVGGYEEYRAAGTPYSGAGYEAPQTQAERGRSATRSPPLTVPGTQRNLTTDAHNPFGDEHEEPSLRSVSPRPMGDNAGASGAAGTAGHLSKDNAGSNSPTESRKSLFREDM
ncbi:MAG: hypothetical protein M1834_001140 [Cirrosporium novae-zelandiae]|nr:MAG: hypothetical protein M1834_001140 [Cirrosporium novae-zelandiae]